MTKLGTIENLAIHKVGKLKADPFGWPADENMSRVIIEQGVMI